MAGVMPFTLRRMDAGDATRRADFLRLHSEENGCAWCRCVAWWVPTWDGWGERSAEENLALREELFDRGEHDGYLLYEGDEPVAWCQVGPRDRLAKLARQFERPPEPGVQAVTCFLVAPRARGRGAARAMLEGVLADLRARASAEGIRAVEGFPRCAENARDPLELWNGPESLFRSLGFAAVAQVGERRVVRLDFEAPKGH